MLADSPATSVASASFAAGEGTDGAAATRQQNTVAIATNGTLFSRIRAPIRIEGAFSTTHRCEQAFAPFSRHFHSARFAEESGNT